MAETPYSKFRLGADTLADLDALAASNGGNRSQAIRESVAYWRRMVEAAGRENADALTPELEAAYRSAMAGWDAAIRAAMVAGLPVDSRAYAVAAEVAAGIQTARENDGFPTVVIPAGPVRGLIVAAAAAGLPPLRRPSESRSYVCGGVRLHADGSGVLDRGPADDAHTAAYQAWQDRQDWRRPTELAAGL